MASASSPKKFPRGQPKSYSTCLLYNTKEAAQKLKGLVFAACNPKLEKIVVDEGDPEAGENIPFFFNYKITFSFPKHQISRSILQDESRFSVLFRKRKTDTWRVDPLYN